MRKGQSLTVKGIIHKNVNSLRIDLGTDKSNLLLHFNPRFGEGEDIIVCNSKKSEEWLAEMRWTVPQFPFKQGEEAMVLIEFHEDKFYIMWPEGPLIEFPIQLNVGILSYLFLGNIEMTSLSLQGST
ncbi:galectin-1-like [Discoglossus pictus]